MLLFCGEIQSHWSSWDVSSFGIVCGKQGVPSRFWYASEHPRDVSKASSSRSNLKYESKLSYLSSRSGCSIVVVYAVWDRVVRVRFPASRHYRKGLEIKAFSISAGKYVSRGTFLSVSYETNRLLCLVDTLPWRTFH